VDELRIGTSWASVTPPAGPSPTLMIAQNGGKILLSWPTNATGFNLYSSPALPATTWTMVPTSVSIVGGQYTVTNTLPGRNEFFRLQLP
jgi:hypothetical protein